MTFGQNNELARPNTHKLEKYRFTRKNDDFVFFGNNNR